MKCFSNSNMIVALGIFSLECFRHKIKGLKDFVEKQLAFLARPLQLPSARVSAVTLLLLYVASFYLVLSRLGPVVSRIGEKAADTLEREPFLEAGLDREDLQSFREVCRRFGELTRVPGSFAKR